MQKLSKWLTVARGYETSTLCQETPKTTKAEFDASDTYQTRFRPLSDRIQTAFRPLRRPSDDRQITFRSLRPLLRPFSETGFRPNLGIIDTQIKQKQCNS